jgi:hypothetical protein
MISSVIIASATLGLILLMVGATFWWLYFCEERDWGPLAALSPILLLTWVLLVARFYIG